MIPLRYQHSFKSSAKGRFEILESGDGWQNGCVICIKNDFRFGVMGTLILCNFGLSGVCIREIAPRPKGLFVVIRDPHYVFFLYHFGRSISGVFYQWFSLFFNRNNTILRFD